LEECGMEIIQHYTEKHRLTIAIYIVNCPILEAC
jgi:hypothetical protein